MRRLVFFLTVNSSNSNLHCLPIFSQVSQHKIHLELLFWGLPKQETGFISLSIPDNIFILTMSPSLEIDKKYGVLDQLRTYRGIYVWYPFFIIMLTIRVAFGFVSMVVKMV